MPTPAECRTMPELRSEIDRIDRAVIALLGERATCIDRAAEIKAEQGLPARIDSRVEEVLAHVRDSARDSGVDPDLTEQIWTLLIEWSIAREETRLGTVDKEQSE